LIFVEFDQMPEEAIRSRDLVVGVAFDFWALTPICDPHPSAIKADGPILPWALPLAGFSGT
jgi:hypothetical protein